MAAGLLTILLSNGQRISVYTLTTQAVGSSPSVNTVTTAATGDPTDFQVNSDCCIADYTVAATDVSGQMEVYNVSESRRTGKLLDQIAANNGVGIANRPIPRICFRRGKTYRFIQTVVHA